MQQIIFNVFEFIIWITNLKLLKSRSRVNCADVQIYRWDVVFKESYLCRDCQQEKRRISAVLRKFPGTYKIGYP
jgi:hypothetical protein